MVILKSVLNNVIFSKFLVIFIVGLAYAVATTNSVLTICKR